MAVELIAGERATGETKNATIACNDYLRMGPGRSLAKLCESYQSVPGSSPTRRLPTLKTWSSTYGWQARADLYDGAIEAEKQAAEKERQRQLAERRKSIMQEGTALDFERVDKLRKLADFLEEQIFYQPQFDEKAADLIGIAGLLGMAEEVENKDDLSDIARIVLSKLDPNAPYAKYPNIWARDVKGLAGGKVVDIVRFNTALLAEFRAILDDIAKETGGRRQRTITENFDIDLSKLSEEQLERITAGEDPLQVIISDYIHSGQG